ncbi:MAG: alpha/beta fold hydrolase [Rhodanobacteraceae bacterium]|nr:alpha/beta fold hydrolase [Rhodanobacteraceae bacterium]MBP6078242.1 alpha/beta fold hydrolase [Xanthomonadales bacterium]MBP7622676.1 alpha/beta fold hydrolase [Xanthomonadales bacterium]
MMKSYCAVAIGIAMALSAADVNAKRTIGSLVFADCDLKNPAIADVLGAQCTTLSVPENPAAPEGRKIDLRIALVPAKTASPEPDPVFFLAGGPGQSALDSFPATAVGFERMREKRHIILVDQRGTGGSNKLICKGEEDESAFSAEEDASAEAQKAFAEKCARQLSDHADPRYYTTTVAVGDLDAVRKALGAAKVNLVGGSYGTRAAQTYLRYYPDSIRSIILDGVAPQTLALGNDHAKNLESALASIFKRCRDDAACFKAYGDPAEDLAKLKLQLRSAEQPVHYRDSKSWAVRDDAFTFGHLASTVRLFAYSPEAAALLPHALNEAAEGRFDTLMAQSDMILGDLGESIMHGMQLSVICSEDNDGFVVDPADADSLLGTDMVTGMQAQCAGWPKGERPKDFHDPITSDVPVLLLSGEFDPVTPPRYGDEAAKGYRNGRHLVVRGRGHIVLTAGCMPKLAAEFIDKTDAKALDASCLDAMPVIPAFLNANGWGP